MSSSGWRAFSGTAATTFLRFSRRAPRIRFGGNVRALRRAGRTERQQGFHRRDAASFADGNQRDGPGFAFPGAESQAGAATVSRSFGAAAEKTARRRDRAPRKNPTSTVAASACAEGTHSRIETPTLADQAAALAGRRLINKFQKSSLEIHLVEATAPN